MKKCIVCGIKFEPKNPKGVYCSNACKMKDRRAKAKELKKEIPSLKVASEIPIPLDEVITKLNRRDDGRVLVGAEIAIAMKESPLNYETRLDKWIDEVRIYCAEIGVTPEELISEHKAMKLGIFGAKALKKDEPKPAGETYLQKRQREKCGVK
jgi:hypothetical protein